MKNLMNQHIWLLFFVTLLVKSSDAQVSSSRMWVFFRDKGATNLQSTPPASFGISERALKRRAKSLPSDHIIDELDLPVAQEYLDRLRAHGVTIRSVSRWLNAVSVEAEPLQLSILRDQPFILDIKQVMVQKRPKSETYPVQTSTPLQRMNINGIDYGFSLTQHTRSKVIDVHTLGISGKNVLLGLNDNGFNYHTTHSSLKNLPVVAEYDFIQRDSNTSIAPGEYIGQGDHGEGTLSIVAGFQNGGLIGAAFGVSVVLAKTEINGVEITLEEDNYIEALEWMERLGVDIVSSSLGYDDLDPMGIYNAGDIVYDMKDGQSGKTSLAGLIAARKGVLLVTAMGNENWAKTDTIIQRDVNGNIVQIVWGTKAGTGSLVTPADADSIVSVGAADPSGILTDFSSTGPTADGRVKPEVVNQGSPVYFASGSTSGISVGGGTSFATPLTAGTAALVLSAHPNLTAMQLREALINTAQQDIIDNRMGSPSYPNNYYGWGFINALDAALYWGLIFSNQPTVTENDTSYVISTKIKSKYPLTLDSLFLFYKRASDVLFQCTTLTATVTADEYAVALTKDELDSTSIGYFSARDSSGISRTNPYDAPNETFSLKPTNGLLSVPSRVFESRPSEFRLSNYPNPFNSSTMLHIQMPHIEKVEVAVFNILGQQVKVLFSGVMQAGERNLQWNGTNEQNISAAAGIYIARIKSKSRILSTKLVLLK